MKQAKKGKAVSYNKWGYVFLAPFIAYFSFIHYLVHLDTVFLNIIKKVSILFDLILLELKIISPCSNRAI